MIHDELHVTNPKGIHARPSALITKAAQEYHSSIRFEFNGETANATDIMEVLSLGVAHGDTLGVTIEGEDEEAALSRLKEIFSLNFGDE